MAEVRTLPIIRTLSVDEYERIESLVWRKARIDAPTYEMSSPASINEMAVIAISIALVDTRLPIPTVAQYRRLFWHYVHTLVTNTEEGKSGH